MAKTLKSRYNKIRLISLFCLLILLAGCLKISLKPEIKENPFGAFIEKYYNRAITCEKNGTLRKALLNWKIVSGFLPYDDGITEKIKTIKEKIRTIAGQHFRKGVLYYQNGLTESAHRKFLLTLTYNPHHEAALDYLKLIIPGEGYTYYQTKKGDTLKNIAEKVYNDPQKNFLIAYFNNPEYTEKLDPSTILRLPIVESGAYEKPANIPVTIAVEPQLNINEMISRAETLMNNEKYQETISVLEKILQFDPLHKNAKNLKNTSLYKWGKKLFSEKEYPESLKMFNRIERGYKDVDKSIIYLTKRLNDSAETHYLKGINHFLHEELHKAIEEWETALTLVPTHEKAKKDIKNAYNLLQKLDAIQ